MVGLMYVHQMRVQPENRRPQSAESPTTHAYPADLARYVFDHWLELGHPSADVPPDVSTLKHLFSACDQASMMREEERAVTFRAVRGAGGIISG
jgi:hypothetical protein